MHLAKILVIGLAITLVPFLANAHDDDEEENGDKKKYEADLTPLNGSSVYAEVEMKLKGNKLTVKIKASGLEPGKPHPQHIHGFGDATVNSTCPPLSADTNGDGLISVGEGGPFYGPIVLPLVPFDLVEASGKLKYKTKFTINPASLQPLQNRVVILHGMTVNGTYDPSLPVACGELELDD